MTSFGESHGAAIGGVIDGCPAGLEVDMSFIQAELARRKPGQSHITTQRDERDEVEILSGVFEGRTLGTPIGFIVRNRDHHSSDYDSLRDVFRPSHADYTYAVKYGFRDHRGGGRSSARETVARVVAGAFAKLLLKPFGITICAFVKQVGDIVLDKEDNELNFNNIESNIVRCPDDETAARFIARIEKAGEERDTVGGVIRCIITGVPAGLGEPVFNKLHADLGYAMLGINAVKGFEYGSGFDGVKLSGAEHNDLFVPSGSGLHTLTNRSGGIQGGISNGEPICFNVAFKPVATLLKPQKTVDKSMKETVIQPSGRHDPCVLPRAVPIVEAMAAIVLANHFLSNQINKLLLSCQEEKRTGGC